MHDTKCVFKELNGFSYKMQVFREMRFVSHCYTVVLCQPILRHSVYKIQPYTSRVQGLGFLKIRDLGSPTIAQLKKDNFKLDGNLN